MVQALYIHQYQLILLMAVASDSSDYVVMINITSNFSWLKLLGFTFLVPAHPGGPGHIPEEQ